MKKINLDIKTVIFTVWQGKLYLLLENRGRELSLPSGKLISGQTIEEAVDKTARRILGFWPERQYTEQLYSFSKIRDSSTYINIVYYLLIPSPKITSDVRNKLYIVNDALSKKSSDREIISYALQRLMWKLEYTNVVYSLIPREFTLSQLQETYEAIFGRKLDKRNFRRKILSLKILSKTGRKKKGEVARPAALYRFKQRRPMVVEVFS